ncbi:hypothetical protein [Allorhodopirellula solitaria]|uniref:Uncharacterized protein n=1 Tax=Allorhodopirellula solitaria TaxID=2527987 RepID=A0A5C5WJ65_9BACT|nr:hypothetical protein [Allorhodopirellula solitaria]TWT50053.1 hypothetical protein CA85_52750 [Allorhodopirellula solitaria]
MKKLLTQYFNSGWLPALVYICLLVAFTITALSQWKPLDIVVNVLLCVGGFAFLALLAASIWNLSRKRWRLGVTNLLLFFVSGVATVFAFGFLMFASMFGPSEDGFADDLTIPEGIEISDPEPDATDVWGVSTLSGSDALQGIVRAALAVPGNDATEFAPNMPSLRKASTDHFDTFRDYIEASPDWHVFMEQGHRFASRRWSYVGEPRDTLHGYISEFDGDSGFQTRCLLCLDRKQWSRYTVQHVQEAREPIEPQMARGNNLHESRVMIECGGVWVEVFEQSDKLERRVTKATVTALEDEFSEFLRNPDDALAAAQARSRELASRLAGEDGSPFRLLTGMQPGIYRVVYSINPGEPGLVYLKAFEVTKGTPLSVDRLENASKTRMTWSIDPAERFGSKAGFTIYEGDWGNPYAARFEVWFKPDSGETERKLAEGIFKIEGWQR